MFDIFKEEYNKLRKEREDLPSIEDIEDEYEISSYINEKKIRGNFPERTVRRSITSILNSYISHLHGFIMPSQHSAISVEENKFLDEEDKEDIIKIMTKLMIFMRKSFSCELKKDKKSDIDFIIETHREWNSIKEKISEKIPKLITGWEESLKEKVAKKDKYFM